MSASLKYAKVERERRFLVSQIPDGVATTMDIVDRYLVGTRLRLREVRSADGAVTRKLGHKARLTGGTAEIACTSFYLDTREWGALRELPAKVLRKRRHRVERDGFVLAVDEHPDGSLVAEIDDGDEPPRQLPDWLAVIRDVSADEAWTGFGLAR